MATILFAVLGNAILPGIGSALGAAVGGYVDNTFIFPALFGKEDEPSVLGPSIVDLQLTTAHEGAPLWFMAGNRLGIPGSVIWTSGLIKSAHTSTVHQGSKGGGGITRNSTTFTYSAHFAILLGEGPIFGIEKIWANGKTIWNQGDSSGEQPPVLQGNQLSVEGEILFGTHNYMKIVSHTSNLDLRIFTVGNLLTASGFVGAGNNGQHNILLTRLAGGNDPAGAHSVVIVEDITWTIEAAGADVRLAETNIQAPVSTIGDVRVYNGTQTQMPDSLIEQFEGIGKVPAFRGRAYVVLESLQLDKFGNSTPQFLFRVSEVEDTGDTSDVIVQNLVDKILLRSGRPTADFDTTALATYTGSVSGIKFAGPVSVRRQLESLFLAYKLTARESEGQLIFNRRNFTVDKTIIEADLGARTLGQSPPPKLLRSDIPSFDLPSEVNVAYQKSFGLHEQGSGRYRRIEFSVDSIENLSLTSLSIGTKRGVAVARDRLWMSWADRVTAHITLPPSYIQIEETDLLSLLVNEETYLLRVSRIERGSNLQLNITGILEGLQADPEDPDIGDDGDDTGAPPYSPPLLALRFAQIGPLRDTDTLIGGFYYGICALNINAEWQGGSLWQSNDDITYTLTENISTEAILVKALTTLATGVVNFWDDGSTVDIEVLEGSLASDTDINVLNGANRIMLGGEVLGFATATLIGTNQYRLSRLIRGLLNTESAQSTHATAETGVVLDGGGVVFEDINNSNIGNIRYFKAVPAGGDIDDVLAETVTLTGKTLVPFAPTHIIGSRDFSNNLTINWVRRTRSLARIFQENGIPLLSDINGYSVDCYTSGDVFLRTLTSIDPTDTSIVYTAANQTTDGITPGDPVKVDVFQTSSIVGRGNTITPRITL